MKHFVLLFAGLLAGASALAQRTCGTEQYMQQQAMANPELLKQRQALQERIAEWTHSNASASNRSSQVVVTIPVVFHVVYKTAAQNVSDAMLMSQLQVLNNDFRKLNADVNQTPALYAPLAADTEIEFCLAQRDPSGNPTTGITRTQTTLNSFGLNDAMKYNSQGGKDAWNTTQYLNIWVCNLGGGLLGYAYQPGAGGSAIDGVVLGYFTLPGGSGAPFNQGRTATHEIGHYFNLEHIWGPANGGNCASDFVADTPTQNEANYNCPSFPSPSCGNSGDMSMNYMDYTNDACMYMFTTGQKTRMMAAINTSRPGLLSSQGCVPVVLQALDASITAIASPSGSSCTSSISPQVTLKNSGQNALTSVTISYKVDNGTPTTYQWTGNLASQATTTITLPSITVTPGSHTFTANSTSPNGGTDGNTGNDAATASFTILSSTAGVTIASPQSFELSTFPPANYQNTGTSANYTWIRNTNAAKTGSASILVNNYNINAVGAEAVLTLPNINLSAYNTPQLTFEVAHKMYSGSTANPDSLEVVISTNCGQTFTTIYKKGGTALTTGPGATSMNSGYVPTGPADWRKEVVSLAPYSASNSAIIKIIGINKYGNNIFLDDIMIESQTSSIASDLAAQQIALYPNPSNGDITLEFGNEISAQTITLEVTDMLGRSITSASDLTLTGNKTTVNLGYLSNGVYLARIQNNGVTAIKRFVINK